MKPSLTVPFLSKSGCSLSEVSLKEEALVIAKHRQRKDKHEEHKRWKGQKSMVIAGGGGRLLGTAVQNSAWKKHICESTVREHGEG